MPTIMTQLNNYTDMPMIYKLDNRYTNIPATQIDKTLY